MASDTEFLQQVLPLFTDLEIGQKIHLEPFEDGWRIRTNDGKGLEELSTLSHQGGILIAEFLLKGSGIFDQALVLPAVGALKLTVGERTRWLQVTSTPVIWGVVLVVSPIRPELPFVSMEKLGAEEPVKNLLSAALRERSGLIIIGGKSGSGRSTTLRAMLSTLASTGRTVSCVEFADQGPLPGTRQIVVDPGGQTAADVTRSILQGSSEVVKTYLDTNEDRQLALQGAETRLVLADMMGVQRVLDIIPRLLSNSHPAEAIARGLRIAIVQRLVPSLCQECRRKTPCSSAVLRNLDIDERFLGDLGLSSVAPGEIGFFLSPGCEKCGNKGFVGRRLVAEGFFMTPELRDLVRMPDFPRLEFEKAAGRAGWVPMRKRAIGLAIRGLIRIEDALMP